MEMLQDVVGAVTAKRVQRAVVNSVVLVSSAVTLLCFAAIASALFFQNFVPDQVVSTPVHLQYGSGVNPYGVASLTSPSLKSQQEYDVSVTLSMPPSPVNVERGNFMVSIHLLNSPVGSALDSSARQFADTRGGFEPHTILFSSRRPVLLPYVDPVVSLASRILFLFYHMLVPGADTCTMIIPLAERVFFAKDSMVPAAAYIEVEAGQTVQIYHATLSMTAQLRGLRWLMFHYRLPTYVTLTFLFWVCEIAFMVVAWATLAVFTGAYAQDFPDNGRARGKQPRSAIKDEEDDGSDVPHTFPTYGKQPPLRYSPEVKAEEQDEPLADIPSNFADDGDADADSSDEGQRDSGIGTSYSEGRAGGVRRRSGRNLSE